MATDAADDRDTHTGDVAARETRHDALLQQVAHRFWIERRTQQQIGEEFSFSRVSISRLLEEARRRGVVSFEIQRPLDRERQLEHDLLTALRAQSPAARAQLRSCRVVSTLPRGEGAHRWRLGLHSALTIDTLAPRGGSLAIASSRTTAPLAAAAAHLPPLTAVRELLGSTDRPTSQTAGAQVALAVGARHEPVPAPFIHRSDERAMTAQTRAGIRTALDAACASDAAVFGAGSMDRFDGTGVHAPVSASTLDAAAAAGAVGHCLGVFFDAAGRIVPSALDPVRVGVHPESLLRVPRRVLLTWTDPKAAIARAVVSFGLVTHLVTDDTTARTMLRLAELSPSPG